jgi:hypothetical protein
MYISTHFTGREYRAAIHEDTGKILFRLYSTKSAVAAARAILAKHYGPAAVATLRLADDATASGYAARERPDVTMPRTFFAFDASTAKARIEWDAVRATFLLNGQLINLGTAVKYIGKADWSQEAFVTLRRLRGAALATSKR